MHQQDITMLSLINATRLKQHVVNSSILGYIVLYIYLKLAGMLPKLYVIVKRSNYITTAVFVAKAK